MVRANRSMEGLLNTNQRIGVRISINLLYTCNSMKEIGGSNAKVISSNLVTCTNRNVWEAHVDERLPVKQKVESSNLSSNAKNAVYSIGNWAVS